MSALGNALRQKFKSPQEAVRALGLDENIFNEETAMSTEAAARKINAIALRTVSVGAVARYLKPRLAMDAKIDMAKVFEGVTGTTFKAKKPEIVSRIKAEAKGKLAKDASLDDVEKVLDMLDGHEIKGGDETVSAPEHTAMGEAAVANQDLGAPKLGAGSDNGMEGLRGFLKEKGMGEDDIGKACGFMSGGAKDEDPEEKKKREAAEAEKKAADEAEEKKKDDEQKAKDAAMKDMVTKPAMDAALKTHGDDVAKRVRESERGIRAAIAEVRPYVGELPATLAFDSGHDVYRHALTMLNVPEAKTIHESALATVLKLQPKAGARQTTQNDMAMDAAAVKSINERFPGIERIGSA